MNLGFRGFHKAVKWNGESSDPTYGELPESGPLIPGHPLVAEISNCSRQEYEVVGLLGLNPTIGLTPNKQHTLPIFSDLNLSFIRKWSAGHSKSPT